MYTEPLRTTRKCRRHREIEEHLCQEQPYPRPHLAAVRVLRHTSQSALYGRPAASRSRSLRPIDVSDHSRGYKNPQGSTFDVEAFSHDLYLRVQGRLPLQFSYRLDIHGILAIILNRPIQVGDTGQGNGGRWRQLEGIRLCDRWWRCVLPFFLILVPLRGALRASSLPHLSLLLKSNTNAAVPLQ